jgi:carboxypeptidase Taq
MTTRCNKKDFLDGLYSSIHEAGHGMYEQGTPQEWRYQPAGGTLGMDVHESQSMIWERQACKSPEFFRFLEKHAREVFERPDDPALSAENMQKLVTQVKPSFIRIEADEVTYPAHVMLRFKLEKALIEGTMTVDELPEKWNAEIEKLLGIIPPDPSKGCMQDVHWPSGLQGYFPAYALGAMGAAQLYAAACKASPEIPANIERGDFSLLKEWLRANVHGKGSLVTSEQLFIDATGEKLNSRYFLDYLRERYLGQPKPAQPSVTPQP